MMDRQDAAASPREIELKLEFDPLEFERLAAHPLLTGSGAAAPAHLRSIYFDTDDLALRKAGISFRLRSDGSGWIQTIKASRGADAVVLDRGEWECAVARDKPDLSAARGTPLEPFLADQRIRRRIAPKFAIEVRRAASRVGEHGAEVELAVDRGRIEQDGRAEEFAEVEIELKRGGAGDLFDAALRLADAAPLRLSFKSKADRGYELLANKRPKVTKAEPLSLAPGTSSASAFQAIGRSCLRHLMANEAVLRRRREPDAVHQMRVAIRRLRAAITLFKDVVADERRDGVRAELKWMADQLGAPRDLDVFVAKVLRPAQEQHEGDPAFEALVAEFENKRDRAYDAALETVAGTRFMRSVLATAAWIEAGAWLQLGERALGEGIAKPVEEHAAAELDRRWKRIRRQGKSLHKLSPEARHEVRIEVKKLRYATEFFGSIFAGEDRGRPAAVSALESLQDTLGDLNDIAVGAELPSTSPAMAMLKEEQRGRVEGLLQEVKHRYRAFREAEPFWRRD